MDVNSEAKKIIESAWVSRTGMRSCYYIRINNTALVALDTTDYYPDGVVWGGRMITRINTPSKYRGLGFATQVLKACLFDADLHNTKLYLEIQSSDGLNYKQLEAWYLRYGFKEWYGIYLRKPV